MPASPASTNSMPDDRLVDLVTHTLATVRGAPEQACRLDAIAIVRSARVAGLLR